MKKLQVSIALIATIFMTACSQFMMHPDNYEEEIHDAAKFYIAECQYLRSSFAELNEELSNPITSAFYQAFASMGVDPYSEIVNNLSEFEDVINNIYIQPDMTYHLALKHLASNPNSKYPEEAKAILKNYDKLTISLSDYELVAESSTQQTWAFMDLFSKIKFLFVIVDEPDQYSFSVNLDHDSVEQYLE